MAKKPTPAELKKQGEELGKNLADIRKKEHNFAMQIGKDGIVFVIDRKKNADVLWRNAKKDGGGPKGAQGRVNMSGKILELDCDDPEGVPKNLVKLAKKHFADRGQSIRLVVKGLDDDGDEDEAEEGQVAEGQPQSQEDEAPAETSASAGSSEAADAPATESESASEAGAEASGDDALREALKDEYIKLGDIKELAKTSANKGVAKKVGGLTGMFDAQIDGDVKKASSIMTLLKNTLDAAVAAGDIQAPSEGGAANEQAVADRRSKLADLEKGVDELLAKFAA